jgi:hypothetical protein
MLDHEIAELRHGIRDLAALSTLPGAWNSCDPERIADSIAAALVTMLDAEFVYVSLRGRQDMPVVEVTRTRDHAGQSHMKNPVGGSTQRNPCYEQRNVPTRVSLRSGTLNPS